MTDDKRPKPLTPPACDLRDFEYMPLSVVQLRSSKSWAAAAMSAPDVGFYMLNLWAAAWHSVPAGSLDNDDATLAVAAMCFDRNRWAEVRALVLKGFVECSDGRIYHRTVSEKVNEAWAMRQKYRRAGSIGGKRKKQRSDATARLQPSSSVALAREGNRSEEKGKDLGTQITNSEPSLGVGGSSSSEKSDDPPALFEVDEIVQPENKSAVVRDAIEIYNHAATANGWATCDKLTTQRGKSMAARLRDLSNDETLRNGLNGWGAAMVKAGHSKFLRGETRRSEGHAGWKPSIDFFLSPTKFAKLMEGAYDDRDGPHNDDGGTSNLDRAFVGILGRT